MTRLYLDASAIIYMVETHPALGEPTRLRVLEHLKGQEAELATSRLSRLECRVQPLRDGNASVLADYDRFFEGARLTLVDVSPSVVERATELRARHGFKTPDALHLATALECGAASVLTGDAKWKQCAEIGVEVVAEPK